MVIGRVPIKRLSKDGRSKDCAVNDGSRMSGQSVRSEAGATNRRGKEAVDGRRLLQAEDSRRSAEREGGKKTTSRDRWDGG